MTPDAITRARKQVQAWEYEKSRANIRLLEAQNRASEYAKRHQEAAALLHGAEAHVKVVEDTVTYAEERITMAKSYLEWLENPHV